MAGGGAADHAERVDGRSRVRAGAAALAACAGAVDLLAFTHFGGAFASIITGNLVTLGSGIGTGNLGKVVSVVIAVAGFATGVALWARLWRSRPGAVLGLLGVEMLLVVVLAAGLLSADGDPGPVAARVLLAVAAVAMGAQSVAGLRLKATTTYLTGTLATAVADAVAARRAGPLRPALVQLGSLVVGAAVTAVLVPLHWAAPFVPLILLGAAMLLLRERSPAAVSPGSAAA
jgi:uncharacterized membrane protein YoaK (UPF0700 family)